MRRLTCKLRRFFWSWSFLKFVLWTVTLVVLFYAEEDWRGAHDWAVTKAKWEARGETFDLNAFTPAPIPDGQNLAAIPLFKLESIRGLEGVYPVALERAMRKNLNLSGNDLPTRGNWMRGDLPDMTAIRRDIAADYAAAFKRPPSGDALAQFDALFPFLSDLSAAVATHPLCRLNIDYVSLPPAARSLGLVTDMIRLSQILTLHALLALDDHRADLALEDIQINYQLLSGVEHNTTLVGGLVGLGMNAIMANAIFYGLNKHAWSEDQLIEIEHLLEPINFLSDYQFDFRSEAAASTTNLDFLEKSGRLKDFFAILGMENGISPTKRVSIWESLVSAISRAGLRDGFAPLWPLGWWDHNKSLMAAFSLHHLEIVDPKSHRAFPQADLEFENQVRKATGRAGSLAPWNFWFTLAAPSANGMALKFAYGQTWVDQARIACALERYWLAYHVYPAALDALVPDQIAAIPHDVINGQAYHYGLRPDGTYLLYSVGWNQRDDGGKLVLLPTGKIDDEHGDWVWPTPK